jgi:hypothetical protein
LRLPIAAFIFATRSNEWLGSAGKTIAGIPKARELNGTQIVRPTSGCLPVPAKASWFR